MRRIQARLALAYFSARLGRLEELAGDATPYVFTLLTGGPMIRRMVHHVVAEAAKAFLHRVSGPSAYARGCNRLLFGERPARKREGFSQLSLCRYSRVGICAFN
jgi:hypothetical protein